MSTCEPATGEALDKICALWGVLRRPVESDDSLRMRIVQSLPSGQRPTTTEEHAAEVLRQRQAQCRHAFIKGVADRAAHCAHCGLPEADYVAPSGWTP